MENESLSVCNTTLSHYIMTNNPVLYSWIFLCLDFTHRISSIYSNIIAPTENKQRTVKSPFSGVFCIDPLKILCLVRSLVLSKRLFRNHIESKILQCRRYHNQVSIHSYFITSILTKPEIQILNFHQVLHKREPP